MKRIFFILFFVLQTIVAICANRYWVNGSGNWDNLNTANWSTTSGGSGGASLPGSGDAVIFDSNSGTGTVTVTSSGQCYSFNGTGSTLTMTGSGINIFVWTGDITLGSGMTMGGAIIWFVFSSSCTITCNGTAFNGYLGFSGTSTINFADNFVSNNDLGLAGTVNTNNNSITCTTIGGWTTANLGSSTITLIGTGTVYSSAATTNAGTSLIKCTNTSNSAITFAGGGKTYNNVWFSRGSSTGNITITGANTFNDLKDDGTAAHTIVFPNSTTTVSTWSISGTSGNLISLTRTGGSGTWTISDASGTNSPNYLSISNSAATGGATWNAGANSTDGGGNTGWIFPTAANTSNFFLFFNF